MKTSNITGAIFWLAILATAAIRWAQVPTDIDPLIQAFGQLFHAANVLLFAWLAAGQIQQIHQSLKTERDKP